jgi:protein phosphatase 1L
MEDRAVAGPVAGGQLVAVFDGHDGALVAERAAARVLALVEAAVGAWSVSPALWRHVFAGLDLDVAHGGATATLLLVRGGELHAAWVGDSQAILVTDRAWRLLTPWHRLDRDDERQRVVAAGAVILWPYLLDPVSEQGLMVTRSLGDRALRAIGVIAEPECVTVPLGEGDVGLVAATDGLWDVVTDEEAATICRSEPPETAAERLVELVALRDGADNVTVVAGRF